MSIHIGAKAGEIAEVVLLPGDPLRAKHIADNLLTDAVLYNEVRGMYGYTGYYNGHRVSVQGTGMGLPSHMIYVSELIQDYGAKVLIRIGTCGGICNDVNLREVIVASSASTDSSAVGRYFPGMTYAPTADFELLNKVVRNAEKMNQQLKVGSVLSSDLFYHFPEEGDAYKLWQDYGVLAVEMETAGLYMLAARHKIKALSLLTVSDHIYTGEHVPSHERQVSFLDMTKLALSTLD